jgi:DNA-binding transcriptional MerR regulator
MANSYTSKQVTTLTELSYQTLNLWAKSGFIKPSIAQAAGRGSERVYSLQDLVVLRVARELRKNGISTRSLKDVIKKLRQQKELGNPLTKAQLVIAGSDVLIVNRGDELTSFLREPGQGCLSFVLDMEPAFREFAAEAKRSKTARKAPTLFPVPQGYTTKQVTRVTGVSAQTLHLWAKSGFIEPSIVGSAGRGSARVYSPQDLVALRVARELRKSGVSTHSLKLVIKNLRRLKDLENPQTKAHLVIEGSDVLMVDSDDQRVSILRKPGQACFAYVLDLEQTFDEFAERAEQLKAARKGPLREQVEVPKSLHGT